MIQKSHIAWSFAALFGISCVSAIAAESPAEEPKDSVAFHHDWAASVPLPFSFVYGGRPSSELIGKWKRTDEEKTLDATTTQHRVVLTDPETGLEIRAVFMVYTDTPAVDWTLYFTNRGDKDTPILENIQAVDAAIRRSGVVTLHRLTGSKCVAEDWLPLDDALPAGEQIEFAPEGGWSSSGASPFFTVQWPGGGVVTAIGWSGQWNAVVERGTDDTLRIRAGMQFAHLKLHPGETMRSPRIMQCYWSGDDAWHGYNAFRRAMFAHIMPRIDGQLVTPPIAHLSTSFYELNDSTEANVLSHLESAKGLGFEVFWLDAYWTKKGFPEGMGNYGFPIERVEPHDRFPNGLRPIGEAVRKAGMEFLVWFEPERVHPKTYLAVEHPDWVISPTGDGGGLMNLGIPDAREYLTKYLNEVIQQYEMDWLRIDYNITPLPYWQFLNQQDPDRVGMAEIRYVEGFYKMWDDIRAAHPHLAIDDCASGGRRIDLETMSRSLPLWRSDNTCDMLDHKPATVVLAAAKNQAMTAGLSRYVPFSTCGQMGSTPYLFRSGMNGGGISFGEDCRPADYRREQLKEAIAEAKRLRPYFFGNYYALGDVTVRAEDWCVLQYDRPKEQDGMVVAFRRPAAPNADLPVHLRGIDPAADYEITRAYGFERSSPTRISGAELGTMKLHLEECPGSVVIEYRRLKP